MPARDLYIEKDASINEEIDRLRLSATFSLMERRDVIVVSTVSCIYGLGLPESYRDMRVHLEKGETVDLDALKKRLVSLQYERNDAILERGRFRVRGDTVEIQPAYLEEAYRIELDWDRIARIKKFNPVSGETILEFDELSIYPAKHFVMKDDAVPNALARIREQLVVQLACQVTSLVFTHLLQMVGQFCQGGSTLAHQLLQAAAFFQLQGLLAFVQTLDHVVLTQVQIKRQETDEGDCGDAHASQENRRFHVLVIGVGLLRFQRNQLVRKLPDIAHVLVAHVREHHKLQGICVAFTKKAQAQIHFCSFAADA